MSDNSELPMPSQAPSGAASPPPPPPPRSQSLMEEVIGTAPQEIATLAARYGIREDDPAWLIAVAVWDATRAGVQAMNAADRIEGATRGVGETIYRQAQAAGKDLAAAADQAIEQKTVEAGLGVVAAMRHAAATAAGELRAVVRGLPQAAAVQRATILEDWKTALASMAVQEAAQRARRGEWWFIGAAFAMMLAGLAAGGYVGHHLAPQTWPAGSPPAAVWRFPKQNVDEFLWPARDAVVARSCPTEDVCLNLRRR